MLPRLPFILAVLCVASARGDDPFSKTLSAADFQAAGLGKLTPGELAKLDALVGGQKTGAVIQAKEETAKAVTEVVRQQVQAEDRKAAKKKESSLGFVDRLKVVLKPGTDIEYTTLEADLVPPFHGWHKGTLFTLSNGQRWVSTDEDAYWAPTTDTPVHVRVVPGLLGSFFMEIGTYGRPRVKFAGNAIVPMPVPAGASP